MATIATSYATGVVTVTGSGYSTPDVFVNLSFTATVGVRRYNEMRRVPVAGGALNYPLSIPFTGGTVVVRSLDPTVPSYTILATSGSQAV